MLTRLQRRNFKGWEDTGPRQVAPLTILFGSNSSGKTSLLQALLLLKQTAESSDRSRVLHTGGERTLVDLGTLSDVIFSHDLERPLDIRLAWRPFEPVEVPSGTTEHIQFTLRVRLSSDGQPQVQIAAYEDRGR
jgi:predicted ATPase